MGLLQEAIMSLAALATVLLQALLDALFPSRETSWQRAERLQQDLNRYQGRDRATRLEKELLLQRRKYEAVVSMLTRAQDENKRMEKANSAAQVEMRELRAERRAQCAARLEALQERERLVAQLEAAERAATQLRRQLDSAAAAGAEARAASSALTQRLAAATAELDTLRHEGADAKRRAEDSEAAAEASRRRMSGLEQDKSALQQSVAGLGAEREALVGRCAELEAELAAAGAEVEDLRQLLDGVMSEKAALAAFCSSLESQAHCMEADYGQLRNWLEEVIEEKASLEARIEDLEGDKAEVLEEKVALEGWVRGSVAEQTETCTRLKSIQAESREQRAELVTHYALLAALLVRLEQRDADVAALKAAAAARPKPQPRMLRALSVPGPPRPRATADASAAEPSAAPLTSPPTSALLTSARAAAPFMPCKEVSALSVPGPQWPRPAAGELPDRDSVPAVSLTSPRETGSSDPCTPSKELVPPRAPKHLAPAAEGIPSATGGERGARDAAGACKRLCMAEDASVSEADSADRCPGLDAVVPEAVGQLSSAVTIRPSGEVRGDDEARELDGVSAGRRADLLDRVPSAAALQLPPAHPQQNWKLLAANAEKPLVMCADCAMPPTPEKHALVQVDAHTSGVTEDLDDLFYIKARPAKESLAAV
ncbi:g1545 [Coccomyxa elongata]